MIDISEQAAEWFEKEFDFSDGQGIRITAKVYGNTTNHEGFSVGVWLDTPVNPVVYTYKNNIMYYIENGDEWLISDYHLNINYNDNLDEPSYDFVKIS